MQLEIPDTPAPQYHDSYTEYSDGHAVAPELDAFRAHLENTGKICPKPWCWQRFYLLYNPGIEPPWLSSWWNTSTREKHDLFLKQLEYLAGKTNRFHAACRFLHRIDNENWLFE